MIKQFEAAKRSPQAILGYTYRNRPVYLVPLPGPDQYGTVYDAKGSVLGHPGGDITGRGDGKMADHRGPQNRDSLLTQDVVDCTA